MKKSLIVEADGGPLGLVVAGANVPDAQLLAATIEVIALELTRFRRLAKDHERLPEMVAGLHLVAFATLMLGRMIALLLAGSANAL